MCPRYIAGLIGLGERKSMQPMAARQDGLSYDRLQHFISVGRWNEAPLARALLAEADRMVGGRDAMLVIDDTSLPKKGRHSVGVAPQYLSTQGKTGNCQALVSLTLARREVPILVGLRLFLPAVWTDDAARMERARVPEMAQAPRTKPEIALDEVDRVRAAGTRFGLVLADGGYGCSATFRAGLSARGLAWAVGVPSNLKVYPADVKLLPAEPAELCGILGDGGLRKAAYRGGCPSLPEPLRGERYAMEQNSNVVRLRQPDEIDDPLTEVLRAGARQLLAQAVELEVEAFLAERAGLCQWALNTGSPALPVLSDGGGQRR